MRGVDRLLTRCSKTMHCFNQGTWASLREMHYWGILLALAIGVVAGEGANRKKEVQEFFTNNQLPLLSIDISPEAAAAIKINPRAYVPVTVKEAGITYANVGLHLKGNYGTFQQLDGKPSLTLNFDKFTPGQKFHGLDKLHLNNGAQDPSYLSEVITSELLRTAGLPANLARVAMVEIMGRPKTPYVLVQGTDKGFLKSHFGKASGNLYESGFQNDISHPLRKLSGDGPSKREDLQRLYTLCQSAEGTAGLAALGGQLNTERLALQTAFEIVAQLHDGYALAANNYLVYFEPISGKANLVLHGMDQIFSYPNAPVFAEFKGALAKKIFSGGEGITNLLAYCAVASSKMGLLTNRIATLHSANRGDLWKADTNAAYIQERAIMDLQQRVEIRLRHVQECLKPPATISMEIGQVRELTNVVLSFVGKAVADVSKLEIKGVQWSAVQLNPVADGSTLWWQAALNLSPGTYRLEASAVSSKMLSRQETLPLSLELWGREDYATELNFITPSQAVVRGEYEATEKNGLVVVQLKFVSNGERQDLAARLSVARIK